MMFVSDVYFVAVYENVTELELLTVHAEDADTDNNARITYSINHTNVTIWSNIVR